MRQVFPVPLPDMERSFMPDINTLTGHSPANPVRWFEIYVEDMSRARRFYEAVFQKPLTYLPPPMPDLDIYAFTGDHNAQGSTGALIKHPQMQPGGGGTLVYFGCADCAVELQRCLDHGGSVHVPKQSIGPYGFMAIVGDSEGNRIGLHSLA